MAFRIGEREIGAGHPPFIILEAGINHNGELEKAKEMIAVAKEAGADAIKFQTFKADEFVADPKQMFTYRSQGKEITESMLEMFRRYEFSRAEWFEIKSFCDATGITFMSSPQNVSDMELLVEIGVPALKVGSDDFTNLPLLERYCETGLPIILSCGMSDLGEVFAALKTTGALDGKPVALLVCTSEYPSPPESVNILRTRTLLSAFPNIVVGFSDHTQGNVAAAMSVALGGHIFEKHFTLSHDLAGPDHWFSEDPAGAASWIKDVRKAHQMLGTGDVSPTAVELQNKREFQRVLVATHPVPKGKIIEADDVTTRRVSGGEGWPPSMMSYLIGRPAPRDFNSQEPFGL
ncbi:N-acetylneuraminate synthase family protein [Mariluticola halotolerans]|uniref:N-acetylneuraminate synthase family protein n=1 Tax=Mariluticola halotolerans TaxID=2909283 RepID=UPI0026E3B9CC|nr:N-acetylneuraminate synthase family protein [Mariluticola halotolerans]UJQ96057.1 N-acetylneuraminate synthase family protein [Mariluticola halotolerans]